MTLSPQELARFIDYTFLAPEATRSKLEQVCLEAQKHRFHGVCVPGGRVANAYTLLENTGIKVIAAVGFPFGTAQSDVKRYETEVAVDDGAEEIDVALNIGKLKEGQFEAALRELRDVCEAADERTVKVIVETGLLTQEEKVSACKIVIDSGARFIGSSTGFGAIPGTAEDIRLFRELAGDRFGVKAGGVGSFDEAREMIAAGADRIGQGRVLR